MSPWLPNGDALTATVALGETSANIQAPTIIRWVFCPPKLLGFSAIQVPTGRTSCGI